MKKVSVTVQYDEEKLKTLKICMENKGIDLSSELTKSLDNLYNKYVPTAVRDFFEMKAGNIKAKSSQSVKNAGTNSKE